MQCFDLMTGTAFCKRKSRMLRAILSVLCAACCAGGLLRAQFAAEDEVRLRRDEPLHFKEGVFRTGKIGETFKVMRYDRAAGRVYLLAFGSDGKPFALHCADSALEPAPKDCWALLQSGVRTMQQGDMAGARAQFVRASTGQNVDAVAMNLALQCETLRKATADLAAAHQMLQRDLAEVARLLRNAQVADRPSADSRRHVEPGARGRDPGEGDCLAWEVRSGGECGNGFARDGDQVRARICEDHSSEAARYRSVCRCGTRWLHSRETSSRRTVRWRIGTCPIALN